MNPKRFTLRKEYFGGLVYDAKTAGIELLTSDEYYFLDAITKEKTYPKVKRSAEFVKKGFIEERNGAFSSPNMRSVIPPKRIRKNVLTAPIRVFYSFTRRCNFQCPHCYFTSGALVNEKRRTIEQTKEIIKKFYDAGTMEWRFTGGEALIMIDIFDAIAYAKSLGMNVFIFKQLVGGFNCKEGVCSRR